MSGTGRGRGTLALAGALALAGCATAPRPTPRSGPAPAGDELLAALHARHAALRTANMKTRTTSRLGGERVAATVLMLVDRPGRLRFDAEAPLQGTVARLAVSGNEFAFLDEREHTLRRGPACPDNVASLIRIRLAADEIAAILLGDAPVGAGARVLGVGWDEWLAADVLHVERPAAGEAATHLWITMRQRPAPAPAGWDVVALAGESPAAAPGARWRVSYQNLARTGDLSLPELIRFAEPGQSFDDGVEIKIKDRIVNAALADAAFRLSAPPDYSVATVSCAPPRR